MGVFFIAGDNMRYPKTTNPFYSQKKWKRKREVILKRDEYECRECRRYGKVTLANTVHHIFELETHPEHKYNNHNLISVCNDCHESFHNRFTNELTDKGLKWQVRMKDKIKGDDANDDGTI